MLAPRSARLPGAVFRQNTARLFRGVWIGVEPFQVVTQKQIINGQQKRATAASDLGKFQIGKFTPLSNAAVEAASIPSLISGMSSPACRT